MRIVGEIDHPILKITVFQMDNRLSVKFESGMYEQTFKFRRGEGADNLEEVKKLVDQQLLEGVLTNFQQMHGQKMATLSRNVAPPHEKEFEDIL